VSNVFTKKSTYCLPKKDSVIFTGLFFRKNYFACKGFDPLEAAASQAEHGLSEMAADPDDLVSLTNWPWMKSLN